MERVDTRVIDLTGFLIHLIEFCFYYCHILRSLYFHNNILFKKQFKTVFYRNKCVLNDIETKINDKNIENTSKIGLTKSKTENLPRLLMSFECKRNIDLSFVYYHEFLRYFKNCPWYVLKHFPEGYSAMSKFCREI